MRFILGCEPWNFRFLDTRLQNKDRFAEIMIKEIPSKNAIQKTLGLKR